MIFCTQPRNFSKKAPPFEQGGAERSLILLILLILAMAPGSNLHGHDARRAEKIHQGLIPPLCPGLAALGAVLVLPTVGQRLLTFFIPALSVFHVVPPSAVSFWLFSVLMIP